MLKRELVSIYRLKTTWAVRAFSNSFQFADIATRLVRAGSAARESDHGCAIKV